MTPFLSGWPQAAERPLDPSADEARSLLRRELLRPEYHDEALVGRLVDWVREQLVRALGAASGSPPLVTLAAMTVLLLLVVALGWLLSRANRGVRTGAAASPALTGEALTAAELRARAEAALAEGLAAAALLDAFRALALRQVELGRVADLPGATAHELARSLGDASPRLRARLAGAARTFDLVRYGGRPATLDQAAEVLTLDDELSGAPGVPA